MMNRRDFLAATAGAALLAHGTATRRLRVGHTGITWGYAPDAAAVAIRDVARLRYHAFESFGSVLDAWEAKGGLGALLAAAKLPLRSAYCPFDLTDPGVRAEQVVTATRWGTLIRKYGGAVAVVGPNAVPRPTYRFAEHRAAIVAALNDIGHALHDVGVTAALHQHTGSCIETRDETYAVLDAVDTRVVGFGPDLGELYAGRCDPVQALRDYMPIVRHVHFKDYAARATHDGYCPLGQGRVDLRGAADVLERAPNDLMIMAELNPKAPAPLDDAFSSAKASRDALVRLGYRFG